MGFLIGDPALRYLSSAKLRGGLMRQRRRLKSPSGLLFALIGGLMLLAWLGSLAVTIMARRGGAVPPELVEPVVRLAVALLAGLSITGSIHQRGLYLPPGELERLFSAPLARADIVRYRLQALLLRSIFGGLLVAAAAVVRLPHGPQAALAALLAVGSVTVLGQGVGLVLGAVEHRSRARALRWIARVLFLLLLTLTVAVMFLALTLDQMPSFRDFPRWLQHPWTARLTWPFTPFGKLASAGEPGLALLWLGICVAILVLLYEGVARLPIDFREWVLESSQALAQRLRRLQRSGTGAAAATLSLRSATRRVPWLFGRGPLGAVAWRKSAGLWRRARTTLTVSGLILAVLVAVSEALVGRQLRASSLGLALLPTALFGILYLCSGLRFDFREDLDRLDAIKAWPLGPRRLFVAMLLPEWCVASLLLGLALVGQVCLGVGSLQPGSWIEVGSILLTLPLAVALWLAIDNALFLVWPVRFVPGQDGPLQNVGRAAVLMLLRGLCFFGAGLIATLMVLAAWWLWGRPVSLTGQWLSAAGAAWLALGGSLLVTVGLGGWALARFDPAQDRP
jgi:Putative ABC exporter